MARSASWVFIAFLASCAPAEPSVAPRPLAVSADTAEYLPYRMRGTLELLGQAFLTTRGGDVKLAAGRAVTLDPATTYAHEWFRRFGAQLERFDEMPSDPSFVAARRTTTADAQGRFRFAGLQVGKYIVRTTVTWEAAGSGEQGGIVAAIVSLPDSDTKEFILNRVYTTTLAAALGVDILTSQQIGSRTYRTIATMSGTSCQVGLISPAPTENEAREDLIVRAARQGADAVANVVCKKRGLSLSPNCTSRIVCEGDGISWM